MPNISLICTFSVPLSNLAALKCPNFLNLNRFRTFLWCSSILITIVSEYDMITARGKIQFQIWFFFRQIKNISAECYEVWSLKKPDKNHAQATIQNLVLSAILNRVYNSAWFPEDRVFRGFSIRIRETRVFRGLK